MENDPLWMADFEAALAELNGHPDTRALVALPPKARPAAAPFHHFTKPPHEFNPNRVSDVMAAMVIRRTTNPLIRDVVFQGNPLGRIAKNPWGPGWAASCDKRILYASMRDAALRLYCEARP